MTSILSVLREFVGAFFSEARGKALAAAVLAMLFAGCQSPLQVSSTRTNLSLTFKMSGVPASNSRASSSRLLLPTANKLTVTLVGSLGEEQAAVSVEFAPTENQKTVSFNDIKVGRYTLRAEAYDQDGKIRFRRTMPVNVDSNSQQAAVRMLPVDENGADFAELTTGGAEATGTLEAGATKTWIVRTGSLQNRTYAMFMSAASVVQLHAQDVDGNSLVAAPTARRYVETGDADSVSYVTLYNSGSAQEAYTVLLKPTTLIAHWKFDAENDYTDSASSIVGTPSGSISWSAGSGYMSEYALFVYSQSLSLSASYFSELSPPWTVAAWVQPYGYADEETLPFMAGSSGNILRIAQPTDPWAFGLNFGGSDYNFSAAPALGDWQHVAIVNDGTGVRLYVNGVQDPTVITAAAAMKLPLSSICSDGTNSFKGTIDDLRVYGAALSADEINQAKSTTTKELTVSAGAHGSVTVNPDQTYFEAGSTVTLTAVPEDSSWQFAGWSGDATGTQNPLTVTLNSDKNITANFVTAVPRYTLSYNYNGGTWNGVGLWNSGEPGVETELVSGAERTAHAGSFTITHPTDPTLYFTGWNTAADGGGTTYLPGDTVTITNQNIVLYAKWANDDAVNYDSYASGAFIPVNGITRGFIQFNGDMDYYRLSIPAAGTLTFTIQGVLPACFTGIVWDGASSMNGPGWDPGTNAYTTTTLHYSGASTQYVYIGHQSQGAESRTGVYSLVLTFTPD